ncbi:MAG: pentapeptide repeat-containing protein [Chloroherpetonaceae bacterium]
MERQQNEFRESWWKKVRSWWEELPNSEKGAWGFSLLTIAGIFAIAATELHCSGGYFLQPFVKADGDDLNAKGKLIYYLIILAGALATLALSLRRHRQTDLERQNTLKKLDQDERKIAQDKRLADDKLYAEIYVRAVEQLGKIDGGRRGDSAAVELRIGGLYALESLARNAQEGYKEIVMKVVTAYIRENARRPQRESSSPDTQREAVALPEDVVVAFRVLNDLAKRLEWKTPIDFERADFEWVDFARVDFPNCTLNFQFAKLNGANLSGKMMNGANLSSAQLNGADLRDAKLNSAYLSSAQLNGAYLRDAKLNGTYLFGVQLNGADLTIAELNGADLTIAELNGADLRGVQLNGVDLAVKQMHAADLRYISLKALTEEQRRKLRTQLTPFNDRTGVAKFLERLDRELARDDNRPLEKIISIVVARDCLHDSLGKPFVNPALVEDYSRKFASHLAPLCTDKTIVASFIKRMQFAQKESDEFQLIAWQALRSKLGEELPKNRELWNALSEDGRAYLRGGAGGQVAQ